MTNEKEKHCNSSNVTEMLVQGARCKFIIEQSMHPLHVMFTVVPEGQ